MRTLVEELGPDAVLFPSLRGVPLVDAWLLEPEQLGDTARSLFDALGEDLIKRNDDRNPLFAASLPNKFLAVVPAARARELGELVCATTRERAHVLAPG